MSTSYLTIFLLLILYSTRLIAQNSKQSDSLNSIIQNQRDSNAINAYYQIGKEYYVQNSLDSAQLYFQRGIDLADQLGDHQKMVSLRRSQSIVIGKQGDVDQGHQLVRKALGIIDNEEMNETLKIDLYINEGALFLYENDLGRAIIAFSEANDLARKHNEEAKRSMLLNNLGILYRRLERYDEALDIYDESYSLRQASKDSMGMANVLMNRSAALAKIDSTTAALSAIASAEQIYMGLDSKSDVMLCQLSRGTIHFDLGNEARAREELAPLAAQRDLPFDPEHEILLLNTLARIEVNAQNINQSEAYLNRVAPQVKDTEFKEYQMDFYKTKSDIHLFRSEFPQATEALTQFISLAGAHYEEEETKLRTKMETQFLSKEKDYEIDLLNRENHITNIRLRSSRIFLVTALLVLGILSLLLYRLYVLNKKVKRNAKEKDTLLREIHHRVKNNLQVISALLTLQSAHLKDAEAREALKKGEGRVQSMALIHKDLYQHDNLKGVNTKDYLEQLTSNLIKSYKLQDEIEVITNVEEIQLDVDTMIPMGLMINELISNALKHAFKNDERGKMEIHLKENVNTLLLTIKDSGPGISENEFHQQKSFGYSLINSFARKLDADISFKKEDGFAVVLQIKNYQKI